jgi:Type VI secretion system/phage-baseplate injector OB domain
VSAKFFGKYRAVVINTTDPEGIGRIQVTVPELGNAEVLGWALPCFPTNSSSKKIGSALPLVGAAVWIEFERGDPLFPIWSGRFFSTSAETPPSLRRF